MTQICRKELCDWNNQEEAIFLSKLLYTCTKINGQIGKNPLVNYHYFKYHGTKEEFEKAKKDLDEFCNIQMEIANRLEKKLKDPTLNLKKVREKFYFLGVEHYIEIEKN